jgi:hypothetical protein
MEPRHLLLWWHLHPLIAVSMVLWKGEGKKVKRALLGLGYRKG